VHAIAFANRDELTGPYYNTSRAGFHLAMDISVYSFTALAKAFQHCYAQAARCSPSPTMAPRKSRRTTT